MSDQPQPPSMLAQGLRFVEALLQRQLDGGRLLPLPLAQQRLAVCATCDQHADGECLACGCSLRKKSMPLIGEIPGKVFYPLQFCPLLKWPPRPHDGVVMSRTAIATMLES